MGTKLLYAMYFYAIMYEVSLFGKPIEQIVVLIACEDGTAQTYIKEKKDFIVPLQNRLKVFINIMKTLTKIK